MKRRGFKTLVRPLLKALAVLTALSAPAALGIWAAGNPPDFDVEWKRSLPADAPLAELARDLWKPEHWPRWFFYLEKVEAIDPTGQPLGTGLSLRPGARLRLSMNPRKGFSRRSELVARVLEFDPARGLALRLEYDSTGRLTDLFEALTWKLELKPVPSGAAVLEGTETGHTRSRRARAWCRLAPAVLLNQIFPVDLMALARIRRLNEPAPVRLGF
jgi:hypothetical protein